MRIVVDRDLCQGHGICEGEAPELFSVTKKGELTVVSEEPSEKQRAGVEQAVRHCPTLALSIRGFEVSGYRRQELEEMVERWLVANRRGEELQDWRGMADLYTEDATSGWNVGPNDEFMAVTRTEIREIALGLEVAGLEGWTYPYQAVRIDEVRGEVMGLWKQMSDTTRLHGSPYEIAGLGESWFHYAGNSQWDWQRDFFDVGNAGATFLEMLSAGALRPGMQRRIERAMSKERLPGHLPRGKAPVGLRERPG
jgi:ferredoxin